MKTLIIVIVLLGLLSQTACKRTVEQEEEQNPSTVLWYDKPANAWTEALPVGNGRLGAMVYGRVDEEIIQFNEETLWTGQPHDYAHEDAHEVLDDLRKLLWDGKQDEAHQLGNSQFMSQPFGQLCYQPFGNILLSFPGHDTATNYNRKLNLENALSSLEYNVNGVKFKREMFASNPDQSLIIRIESTAKASINFTIGLDSPHSNYNVSVQKRNNYKGKTQ